MVLWQSKGFGSVAACALDSLDAQMGMDKNPFKTYELIMGINIR
jgi:hypothetical protein